MVTDGSVVPTLAQAHVLQKPTLQSKRLKSDFKHSGRKVHGVFHYSSESKIDTIVLQLNNRQLQFITKTLEFYIPI